MRRVHLVAVGPEEHGVTRHALQTAALAERELAGDWTVETVRCTDAAEFQAAGERLRAAAAAGDAVHVDVTDALFGQDPAGAAAVLRAVLPGEATLALHDVPQPAEGAERYAARAAAYAALAGAFAGVVVASEHEAGFLRRACTEAGVESAPIAVVPLPVPDERGRAEGGGHDGAAGRDATDGETPGGERSDVKGPRAEGAGAAGRGERCRGVEGLERDVVVLGHLYPGKGHAEAVAALAAVRRAARVRGEALDGMPDRVTALGPVAAGHEDVVAELEEAAAGEGLGFRVTGFVPDAQLPAALAAAAVPFAAHRNVSASGSLATWMGHGRRCIVPAGAYVEEMDALRPGTLHVARPEPAAGPGEGAVLEALTAALAEAVADPALTRLAPGVSLVPTPEDTVRALAGVWARARETTENREHRIEATRCEASETEATTGEGGGDDD